MIRLLLLLSPALTLLAAPLYAQRAIELSYGRSLGNSPAALYSASMTNRLIGPLHYGIGVIHLQDQGAAVDRTQTGAEITLSTSRARGLYGIVGVGLAHRYSDQTLDGSWSAGLGYGFRVLSALSMGIEGRYRVEDSRVRGFWRLSPSDRRAITLEVKLRVSGGVRAARPTAPPAQPVGPIRRPDPGDVITSASDGTLSEASAAISVAVVETALGVMGTPYVWGGTGGAGFDCSGLIQYAYGEHGIILPRVSRDQARTGVSVSKNVDDLRPGDILTFAANGSGISHVGLYVGDGSFIHSASSGVKLSSLTNGDATGRWWRDRWVGARRVLQ